MSEEITFDTNEYNKMMRPKNPGVSRKELAKVIKYIDQLEKRIEELEKFKAKKETKKGVQSKPKEEV